MCPWKTKKFSQKYCNVKNEHFPVIKYNGLHGLEIALLVIIGYMKSLYGPQSALLVISDNM